LASGPEPRRSILEVFKMKNGSSSLRFDEFFEAESQHRTRGHSWKIVKQRHCLDLRKYFFSARVVDRWNRLDQKDIDIDTINGFKRRLEIIRNTRIGFFMD